MVLIDSNSLEGIARAFSEGDAAPDVTSLEEACRVCDIEVAFSDEKETWRFLFEALNERQSKDGNRRAILAFLRTAMQSARYSSDPDTYSALRLQLNECLVSCGIRIDECGDLRAADRTVRPTMPTWKLTVSSYIRTFRSSALVLSLSWAPLLAGMVVIGFLGVAVELLQVSMGQQYPVLQNIYAQILLTPFAAIYLVAWYRHILLGEMPKRRWIYFRIYDREKLFALALLTFVAITIPPRATSWGYLYLMVRKSERGGFLDQWDVLWAHVIQWTWFIIIVTIFARLLWVLPEIAIDKGFSLHRCWRLTRGYTLRLAIGLVLILVPIQCLRLVIGELLAFHDGTAQTYVSGLLEFVIGLFAAVTTATYSGLTYEHLVLKREAEEPGNIEIG